MTEQTPARVEHVNITVSDAKATATVLAEVFGWNIRWEGPSLDGGYSVHVGGKDSYLALYAPATPPADTSKRYGERGGLNHIGLVVDDLDAAEAAVMRAGYKPTSHADYEPGRRFYFFGDDGVEYEMVSYSRPA